LTRDAKDWPRSEAISVGKNLWEGRRGAGGKKVHAGGQE